MSDEPVGVDVDEFVGAVGLLVGAAAEDVGFAGFDGEGGVDKGHALSELVDDELLEVGAWWWFVEGAVGFEVGCFGVEDFEFADSGDAEAAGGVAVEVVADEVEAVAVGDDSPGVHPAFGVVAGGGALVVEADALFGGAGFGDEVEVVGAEGVPVVDGGEYWCGGEVGAGAAGGDFGPAGAGECGELVALSHFAGESEDGCFFWSEGDFWEFVVVGAESPDGVVAGFVHFEGDAGADEAA